MPRRHIGLTLGTGLDHGSDFPKHPRDSMGPRPRKQAGPTGPGWAGSSWRPPAPPGVTPRP
eukprot:3951561-Alexandrium_andersonii.AAC.1